MKLGEIKMYNLLVAQETTTTIMWIVLGVILIAWVVFSIFSNKKKQQQAQNMVNSLKKGDRVKTIGGICGFVVEVNDNENTFVLETGLDDNKSYVKFDKGAIYQTAPAQGNAVEPKQEAVEEKKEEVVEENKEAEKTEEAPKKTKRAKSEDNL